MVSMVKSINSNRKAKSVTIEFMLLCDLARGCCETVGKWRKT